MPNGGKHVGQENGQGLLVLGISDDVVEGHAGSAATNHDAAQNLCLAFTSLTAAEKSDRCICDLYPREIGVYLMIAHEQHNRQ